MPSFNLLVYRSGQLVDSYSLDSMVVVGRRDLLQNDPAPIALHRLPSFTKVVIADTKVQEIPRQWFRMAIDNKSCVFIENLHPKLRVAICNQNAVASGQSRHFEDEITIDLGCNLTMRVSASREDESSNDEFRTLAAAPFAPNEDQPVAPIATIRQFSSPDAKEIANMLRLALQVVQKAAGSTAFFQAAAVAAAQIVELDRVVVLLRKDIRRTSECANRSTVIDGWSVVAEHLREGLRGESLGAISRTILHHVFSTGITAIHDPGHSNNSIASTGLDYAQSLMRVCCATASPILNRDREVIGVLYGDRWSDELALPKNRISDIEATLVEVLASSVAAGIARQAEESLRTTLAEFFSPKVVKLLADNPELMDGQDAEVSVLFCDIRGFSSVTEKLGPQKAIQWINDVMSELSQCVIDRDGVLVDYVGDELLAMWGAPGSQPDHAHRAMDAARAMMAAIDTLRTRWFEVLPQRFGAGIGVNTGPARVGNVGSRQKFKYGALGNTVNFGSRLQSATKQFGVDCIVSGESLRTVKPMGDCRRLALLSVVGIDQAIEVFELKNQPTGTWEHLAKNYELALADFEAQRFGESVRRIGELLQVYPDDRPCKKLLARAVKELDEPSDNFSPIWNLTQK